MQRDLTGIETRVDSRGCESFRGYVSDHGKKVRGDWTYSYADARAWRVRCLSKIVEGIRLQPIGKLPTIRSAGDEFLDLARAGIVLSRKGEPYAHATLRAYEMHLRLWIYPVLGDARVDVLRRSQISRFADDLSLRLSGGAVRNVVNTLCAIYAFLLPRYDELADPTHGLALPAPSKPRERYADKDEMVQLLGVLPHHLALPLALAFYAGLRCGEIRALAVDMVSDDWIEVEWQFVDGAGFTRTKTNAGKRAVPVFDALRPYLRTPDHLEGSSEDGPGTLIVAPRKRTKWGVRDLGSTYQKACERYWSEYKLEPIGLHEGRHSFITALIRAGYDIKLVQEWAGHASAQTTLDIYTKRRGRQEGLAERMNGYLA